MGVELWNRVFFVASGDELCRWMSLIESREHSAVFIRILILPEQDCNKTELQTPAASLECVSLH